MNQQDIYRLSNGKIVPLDMLRGQHFVPNSRDKQKESWISIPVVLIQEAFEILPYKPLMHIYEGLGEV